MSEFRTKEQLLCHKIVVNKDNAEEAQRYLFSIGIKWQSGLGKQVIHPISSKIEYMLCIAEDGTICWIQMDSDHRPLFPIIRFEDISQDDDPLIDQEEVEKFRKEAEKKYG